MKEPFEMLSHMKRWLLGDGREELVLLMNWRKTGLLGWCLQSCRVNTGLEFCSPADLLKSSPWPRQALTWVSLLLSEACQAGTELGRYPSSDQSQMRS